MAVESLFPRLEPLLPLVQKPIQYVGGELNSTVKDWDAATVRWALMYPDAYEVGLPNQGVQILYEVLNERDWILAERTYAVWPDLEKLMRERGVQQFTVDGHRPVGAFDVLGVSFATELGYTNLLTALDLAGIPLESRDRTDEHPIVLAGGHSAFNPEPIADFLDAAVLGDGEEVVLAISEVIREWKDEGSPGGRDEVLFRLAVSGAVYVPRFFDVEYLPDGRIKRVVPNRNGIPWRVVKHTLMDLDEWPYPKKPLVPLAETVHERFSVEIFRGCTRGCRFCQAGMITRPVRERSITTIGDMVKSGIESSGFEEVGLLSLSSADHSEIGEVAKGLADRYEGTNVSLSLPSTRVDAFNIALANELSRNGRRSGLTFAPEGGSERMRKVINKMVSEDDLIRTVETAYANGWRQVKLYFMCGLPTETDEDVLEIAELARKVIAVGRKASGRRDIRCTVSIGGFVPKPHTPFQWAGQCGASDVELHVFSGSATLELWTMGLDKASDQVTAKSGTSLRASVVEAGSVTVERGMARESWFVTPAAVAESRLSISDEYVNAIRAAKPLAYWRFEKCTDGLMLNEMGDRLHCRMVGDAVRWRSGADGSTVEFGTSAGPGYLISDDTLEGAISEDYTIELWAKPTYYHHGALFSLIDWMPSQSPLGTHRVHLELCGPVSGFPNNLRPNESNPGRIRFINEVNAKWDVECYSAVPYSVRKWQHIVALKDQSTMRLYVNGELADSQAASSSFSKELRILMGQLLPISPQVNDEVTSRLYGGELDEVALYDRALSQEEIDAHFDQGPLKVIDPNR